MASRALGALLALAAALAFVVSIASSAWWAGHPIVEGRAIHAKDVYVGLFGATGCNTGGDGSCEVVRVGEVFQIAHYGALGATALAALLVFLLAFSAWRIGDARKALAKVNVLAVFVAAAAGGAVLVLGPDIQASQRVEVPIGWGAYVFGGAVLASLFASVITRRLEPEPLRLKTSRARLPRPAVDVHDMLGAPSAGGQGAVPAPAARVGAHPAASSANGSYAHPAHASHPGSASAAPSPEPSRAHSPSASFASPARGPSPSAPPSFASPPSRGPSPSAPPSFASPPRAHSPSAPPPFSSPLSRTHSPSAPPRFSSSPSRAHSPSAPPPFSSPPSRASSPSAPPPFSSPPSRASSPSPPPLFSSPPPWAHSPSSPPPVSSRPSPLGRTPSAERAESEAPARPSTPSASPPASRSTPPRSRTQAIAAVPPPRPSTPDLPVSRGSTPSVPMPSRNSAPKVPMPSRSALASSASAVRPPGRARTTPGPGIDVRPDPAGVAESKPSESVAPAPPGVVAQPVPAPASTTLAHVAPPMPASEPARGPRAGTEVDERLGTAMRETEDPDRRAQPEAQVGDSTETGVQLPGEPEPAPVSNQPAPGPRSEATPAQSLADELAARQHDGGDSTDQSVVGDDLMQTIERDPKHTPIPTPKHTHVPEHTPIPTMERASSQVPISTAPSSLPPPRTLETVSSGPRPACPQCEAPMAWVEEHLRFYCKQCRMYF